MGQAYKQRADWVLGGAAGAWSLPQAALLAEGMVGVAAAPPSSLLVAPGMRLHLSAHPCTMVSGPRDGELWKLSAHRERKAGASESHGCPPGQL